MMVQAGGGGLDSLLRQLVGAVVFLFPAVCLLVNHSDSICMILLAAVGIWIGFRHGFTAGITRYDAMFVAACAGFFLSAVISFTFVDHAEVGFHLLGRYLRLLLALPVLLALKRYRPTPFLVWSGLGLGALLLGVEAVSELVFSGGDLRAQGDTNVAILFGDLAVLTVFTFITGYLYIVERFPRSGPALVMAGVASGLLAVFLSGTRGAWIAVPLLLLLLMCCRGLRMRTVLGGAVVMTTVFVLLYFIPSAGVRDRVAEGFEQIHAYWQGAQGSQVFNGTPNCLDRQGALRAWLDVADFSQAPAMHTDVVAEQGSALASLTAAGCGHGQVIRLHNNSSSIAVADFPHFTGTNKGISSARLFVRGQGTAWYVGYAAMAQRAQGNGYTALALQAPANYGDWLRIEVPSGGTLWLVPVENHAGEYSASLAHSPIGQRLEMWRAALLLFYEAPWLGVGTGAYHDHILQLTNAGQVAPVAAEYDHPHSDYFDALSSRGLLGMLALLGLLGTPGWLFLRAMRGVPPHVRPAALAGLLVATGFGIFGLTETMFIHSLTITWYVIMTAVFLAMTDAVGAGRRDTKT